MEEHFNEHRVTLILDAESVDVEKAFMRIHNAACTCRRHWWQLWRSKTDCAVTLATMMPVKSLYEEVLWSVDELEQFAATVHDMDSFSVQKYDAHKLLVDAAAHARGAANQLAALEQLNHKHYS